MLHSAKCRGPTTETPSGLAVLRGAIALYHDLGGMCHGASLGLGNRDAQAWFFIHTTQSSTLLLI